MHQGTAMRLRKLRRSGPVPAHRKPSRVRAWYRDWHAGPMSVRMPRHMGSLDRTGEQHVMPRWNKTTIEQRFWSKVRKTPHGCWLWTGGTFAGGYGAFHIGKPVYRAHRVSWELTHGPIPEGMFICHHCDTPACVRPDHLFLGTNADNVGDMTRKRRVAHGERHGSAKLSAEQVQQIRRAYSSKRVLQRELAQQYGVDASLISMIVTRKLWTDLD